MRGTYAIRDRAAVQSQDFFDGGAVVGFRKQLQLHQRMMEANVVGHTGFLAESLSHMPLAFKLDCTAPRKEYDGKKTTMPSGTTWARLNSTMPRSDICV